MLRPHDWLLKRSTMFLEGEVELSSAHPYWYFPSWSCHGFTSKSLANGKIQRKNQNNYPHVTSLCSTGNTATHSCTVLENTGPRQHISSSSSPPQKNTFRAAMIWPGITAQPPWHSCTTRVHGHWQLVILSIFSHTYWQFVYLIWENVYSGPAHFKIWLVFCYWVVWGP